MAAAETAGAGLVVIGGLLDGEHTGGAEAEADALAESILAAAEPEAFDCASFVALIAFAQRTRMFGISSRHLAALDLLRGAEEAGA